MAIRDPKVVQPSWLNPYNVTKNWDAHMANPGLGGTDWGMAMGTNLLASAGGGIVEQATASTRPIPSWYNSGLGYATAIRRSNGTRTVMAHNSAFVVPNGTQVAGLQHVAESGGAKGTPGAGTSTGPHVHIHDVLADGKTRVPAFSTITDTSGGGGVVPITQGDATMFMARDVQTGSIWLYTDNGRVGIQHPTHVTYFQRAWSKYPNYDNYYGTELDIMLNYITAASTADDAERKAILDAVKAIPTMTPAQITKVITDAVNAALADADVTVEVDYAKIASDVDKALADNFAAIPDAVADEQAQRLQS